MDPDREYFFARFTAIEIKCLNIQLKNIVNLLIHPRSKKK